MGGRSGGGDSTTTQEPWDPQKPYLTDLFSRAQDLLNNKLGTYRGPGVAPLTADQIQALNLAPGIASRQGRQAQNAYAYANSLMQPQSFQDIYANIAKGGQTKGELLDVGRNPYVQRAAAAATRPIYQQLTEAVLPSVRGESLASGFYGGNRQGIAEGLAAGRTAQAAGDATSRLMEAAYGRGLEALTAQRGQSLGTAADVYGQGLTAGGRALALAPTIQQMQNQPADTLLRAGTAQRDYNQALLNDAINKFYYKQGLPFQQLAQYQQLVQGGYGGSVTQPQPHQNPLMSALGGTIMGGAAGSMLGGAAMGGPVGAGIGGLLSIASLL